MWADPSRAGNQENWGVSAQKDILIAEQAIGIAVVVIEEKRSG